MIRLAHPRLLNQKYQTPQSRSDSPFPKRCRTRTNKILLTGLSAPPNLNLIKLSGGVGPFTVDATHDTHIRARNVSTTHHTPHTASPPRIPPDYRFPYLLPTNRVTMTKSLRDVPKARNRTNAPCTHVDRQYSEWAGCPICGLRELNFGQAGEKGTVANELVCGAGDTVAKKDKYIPRRKG